MRSPRDNDEVSKMVYHSSLFDTDDINSDISDIEKGFFKKLKKFFGRCCHRRSKGLNDDAYYNSFNLGIYEPKKMYSFTELEIQKMMRVSSTTANTACQTGESLEIDFYNEIKERIEENEDESLSKKKGYKYLKHQNVFPQHSSAPQNRNKPHTYFVPEHSHRMPHDSELSMLRFMKEARTEAEKNSVEEKARRGARHDVACGEELELYSTYFDRPSHSKDETIPASFDVGKPGPSGYQRKRIRFDDNLITNISSNDEIEEDHVTDRSSHGMFVGTHRFNQDVEEEEQHSAGRDFMRFFGGKSKKPKKEKKTNTLKFV